MHRTLLAFFLVVSAVAAAQASDEWSTFPPAPAAQPQPQPKPAPEPAPAATTPVAKPAPAPAKPAAQPAAAAPKPAAAAPKPAADGGTEFDQYPIVAQRESYEPGTEPHSPSTWGNAWNAPENSRVSVGQYGIGTVFVPSARLGAKGVVRVSFLGEYFNQGDFPVRGAQNIRSGITFAASFQPFTWGEVFLAYGASANTNNKTSPNLLQALGDLTLGIKGSYQFFNGFWAGADLRLLTFSGVGNQGVDKFAFGFKPTLLATYDWRALSKSVPLVSTAALGFTFDSTAGLITNQTLNASEQFALGINEYHRITFGLAVEVPLPFATPFIEYTLSAPLGVPAGGLIGPDTQPVGTTEAMPQNLNLGAKITAVKDLTVTSGVNIGLSRKVGLGVPATPPWNFYVSAAFAIDPFQRGEIKRIETVRLKKEETVKPPPRLAGTVTDKESGKPVAGVLIDIAGSPRVASDDKGAFTTQEVKGPKVTLKASRDGYKSAEQTVELPADPAKPLPKVALVLEPDVKKAKFAITATAAKKPVKAQIAIQGDFEGAGSAQLETGDAPAEAELPAGKYVVNATADGFLAQTREVQVTPGATMAVAFELVPAPKKPLVIFKGDKIEILQQVHFQSGKSVILADSFNLLAQVVDAIIKNGVKRVRVEGHTDNRGKKDANQKLSEDRARAVADYLIAQGIEAQRIESVGYGDSKPVAPNLTARGRELNRRVEFIVLEK
ncbi:MAG: OmpA family protein [Myxococcota bacterium]|jgi:outer membrane protein OmpA-like peptidoglycan-associated protein